MLILATGHREDSLLESALNQHIMGITRNTLSPKIVKKTSW